MIVELAQYKCLYELAVDTQWHWCTLNTSIFCNVNLIEIIPLYLCWVNLLNHCIIRQEICLCFTDVPNCSNQIIRSRYILVESMNSIHIKWINSLLQSKQLLNCVPNLVAMRTQAVLGFYMNISRLLAFPIKLNIQSSAKLWNKHVLLLFLD